MTTRQRLKLKMLVSARRGGARDRAAFKQSMLGLFDCLTAQQDRELLDELDRIEEQRMGITRLMSEVWNELERERSEDALLARWASYRG